MVRKANCMLRSFAGCDPIVKTKLFRAFCLSLYGSALWNISSSSLNSIEVAFNNTLRRIWSVPQRTHTGILHCLAGLPSVYNTVLSRSKSLIYAACSSSSFPASSIFRDAGSLAYTFSGFNSALVLDLAKPMTLKTNFVLMSFVATDFLLANPPLLKRLYLLLPVVNLSFFFLTHTCMYTYNLLYTFIGVCSIIIIICVMSLGKPIIIHLYGYFNTRR